MTTGVAERLGNAIWSYPWDLLDGGLDRALAEIAGMGLQSVSVTATYHASRLLLPWNPRRRVFTLEPDRADFQPDPARYPAGGPYPVVSQEYAERDPLAEICAAAPRHGLQVQAWTIFLHNSRIGEEYRDLTVANVFGDRYVHALCPSQPAVRAYALALAEEIATQYPIAALDVEALGFLGYKHNSHHDKASLAIPPLHNFLLSLCFCPSCREQMDAAGADSAAVALVVRGELEAWLGGDRRLTRLGESAGLVELLGSEAAIAVMEARDGVVLSLLAEMRRRVPERVALQVRTACSRYEAAGKTAAKIEGIAHSADGLVFSFLSMQTAAIEKEVATLPRALPRPRWAGISVGIDLPDSPDEDAFRNRLAALRARGMERFYFYNYGLMPRPCLAWISRELGAG